MSGRNSTPGLAPQNSSCRNRAGNGLLDAGEHERARRVLRQWRDLPPIAWTSRPRAWALLTLAALERRCGDEVAAARCLDEARRGFLALADEPGLAYLDSHAEPLLSER